MKNIGGLAFPEVEEEFAAWTPVVRQYPLHCNVLCVARTRIEGKWKAYCGPVPGQNHDLEVAEILQWGDQLSEAVAKAMFPDFSEIPYDKT